MIVQRYATADRIPRTSIGSEPRKAPALAGRQRLATWLEASFLARLMLAMVLVATAFVIYLHQASQGSVLDFSIQALQQQQAQLSSQNAALEAQLQNLQSSQRIDSIATHQLGMFTPNVAPAWLTPTVPRFPAAPPPGVSLQSADQASQPLSWMQDFVAFVGSSL